MNDENINSGKNDDNQSGIRQISVRKNNDNSTSLRQISSISNNNDSIQNHSSKNESSTIILKKSNQSISNKKEKFKLNESNIIKFILIFIIVVVLLHLLYLFMI